jgi:polysaccharide export outer membrane protein
MLLMAVAALSACNRTSWRQPYAASPRYAPQQYPSLQYQQQRYAPRPQYAPPAPQADLDTMMYGAPAPYRPQQPGYRPAYAPPAYRAPPNAGYRPARAVHWPTAPLHRPAKPYVARRSVHALPVDDGPYTLDTGDRLRIVVYGQDTLSNTYAVDAAGQVTIPLIGAVPARDLTTAALASSIKSQLASGFIREPSVAVEIDVYRPFFVLGEVTYPGQYPFVPRMTVENAVAIAGGFTPRAGKSKVTVTRKIQGTPAQFAMPLHYPIRPGDIVTVAERWF